MQWSDLEKMTVVRLREEAMMHAEITGAHGKTKPQLIEELSKILGVEKPHVHFSEKVVHTKGDLKKKIHTLKAERDKLLGSGDHKALRPIRRQIHDLKRHIRKIEARTN